MCYGLQHCHVSVPPTPASSNNRLKESMALLELDFAEFKERTQARQGSVEALKQENSVLRVQLAKVRGDAECREKSFTRQVQHLTEKLSSVLKMTSRETQTLPASVPGPPSLLSTQPNNTLAPPDTPTQPAAHSQLCPSQSPSTQPEEQDPQRPYRPSQTASSPSPSQDHHPCCEETQQLSLDLPLPTPPTHPEE
ncbi:hypothetical protein JOQ06_018656, partial [Pogonophryne albipinna]